MFFVIAAICLIGAVAIVLISTVLGAADTAIFLPFLAVVPQTTSTPAPYWPDTTEPSCGTATPATTTSVTRCTPGAAPTGFATSRACTSSTPAARCGPSPSPTCLSMRTSKPTAARAAGQASLPEDQLAEITAWYHGAVAKGIADNQNKRGKIGRDGLGLARRFRDHQDMILRFATDLTVGFTSNQAERDIRPVKIQQRTSGGCWRTLDALADFAIVRSYLSTAAKWDIDALDAFTQLFTDGPWLPAAISPG